MAWLCGEASTLASSWSLDFGCFRAVSLLLRCSIILSFMIVQRSVAPPPAPTDTAGKGNRHGADRQEQRGRPGRRQPRRAQRHPAEETAAARPRPAPRTEPDAPPDPRPARSGRTAEKAADNLAAISS